MELTGPVLTIDLEAIARNYRRLRDRAAGAECAAVVKANAYNLGIERVAPALQQTGCRTFFVATLEEGVALRSILGERAEILILNGVGERHLACSLEHRLTPVLNDLGQIEAWSAFARQQGRPLSSVIHVDTGMSRLGLPDKEIRLLRHDPARLAGLEPLCLMSHLLAGGEPQDEHNAQQRKEFAAHCRSLRPARASLANSAGVLLGTSYHFDLVRPGIALYGSNPRPADPNPFSEVVRLTAKILQVRYIDPPQTVGYDASWSARKPTRIATLPVGYADGYLRSLGNRGFCAFDGILAPIVGRISMDLITVDVTELPEERTLPGSEATIIGHPVTLDSVAISAGTIAYEILTSLGPRYRRVYRTATGESNASDQTEPDARSLRKSANNEPSA